MYFLNVTAAEAEAAGKPTDKLLTKNQIRAKRKLFLAHTVQHVYTDVEIKSMVQKSIGLDKSKVTEFRYIHTALYIYIPKNNTTQQQKYIFCGIYNVLLLSGIIFWHWKCRSLQSTVNAWVS